MAKNDYRRQLIMLRGLEKGYGGHARLEKRVLTGSMDFVTTAANASDRLEAAFVGVRGGRMQTMALGNLKDAPRGQKALLATFDPRNIAGMDLGEVQAAVISRVEDGRKTPVMYGCINGVCALDWTQIVSALNAESAPAPESPPDIIYAPVPVSAEVRTAQEAPPVQEESPVQEADIPQETAVQPETKSSAASFLEVDMTKPWPEDIESLRLLFMTLPRYEPFDMDGYVFIRAKMADETNIDHCAVGVRAESGRITGVCYALPMPYSPEPPAGLEEYRWMGDTQSGWWVTCEDIESD